MWFRTETDRQMFELELSEASGDHRLFVHRRKMLVGLVKDFRKSQQQKHQWATNRFRLQQSITKYSKSPESKRFHRQLGRFLATRVLIPKQGLLATRETLTRSLMNLRQELNEERNYFHTVLEQALLEDLIEDIDLELSVSR